MNSKQLEIFNGLIPLAMSIAWKYARRIGCEWDIEDMKQDAMVALILTVEKFGEGEPLHSHLKMTMRKEIIMGILGRMQFSRATYRNISKAKMPRAKSLVGKNFRSRTEEFFIDVEARSQLDLRGLVWLTDAQCRVLELTYNDGYSPNRISEELGFSLKQVRELKASGIECLITKSRAGTEEIRSLKTNERIEKVSDEEEKRIKRKLQEEESEVEQNRVEIRRHLGKRAPRPRRQNEERKHPSTRFSRRLLRLKEEGLCPHCRKPCAPYSECEERREQRRAWQKNKRLAKAAHEKVAVPA